MIMNSILVFLIKKFLLKTGLLGGKEIIAELRQQIKEQQEYIDFQTKKIIELQNVILKGR